MTRSGIVAGLAAVLCLWTQGVRAEVCTGSKVTKAVLTTYDQHLVDGLTAGETTAAIVRHLPFGTPACDRLLPLKDYLVCYDIGNRVPAWVAYELTAGEVTTKERRDAFRTDPRLSEEESSSCADYKGSGFDRGHSVPRDDMNRTFELQAGTFLLSNMSPQTKKLNEGIWAFLEQRVRSWAKANGTVYVISGPIFRGATQRLNARVAIPTAFFKIVLRQVDGTIQAQSFTLSNANDLPIPPGGFLHATLTEEEADLYLLAHAESMKKIEQLTGLHFLTDLQTHERQAIEQNASTTLWPID
jgi:DNA/RNA endonuclease G (NUC1)